MDIIFEAIDGLKGVYVLRCREKRCERGRWEIGSIASEGHAMDICISLTNRLDRLVWRMMQHDGCNGDGAASGFIQL